MTPGETVGGVAGVWGEGFTPQGHPLSSHSKSCVHVLGSKSVSFQWVLAWDWLENRSSGGDIAFTLPHRCDKKITESQGKAFNLPVDLHSYLHLWA